VNCVSLNFLQELCLNCLNSRGQYYSCKLIFQSFSLKIYGFSNEDSTNTADTFEYLLYAIHLELAEDLSICWCLFVSVLGKTVPGENFVTPIHICSNHFVMEFIPEDYQLLFLGMSTLMIAIHRLMSYLF
jgi:hypothetical protein